MRTVIGHPEDLYDIFWARLKDLDREAVMVVALDGGRCVIDTEILFYGDSNRVSSSPKPILRWALKFPDVQLLAVAHNHPSGNSLPSEADVETAKEFCKSCEAVGVVPYTCMVVAADEFAIIHEAYSVAKRMRKK